MHDGKAIRTRTHKLLRHADGLVELYDLEVDLFGAVDLYEDAGAGHVADCGACYVTLGDVRRTQVRDLTLSP
jgi:hypothetical protein